MCPNPYLKVLHGKTCHFSCEISLAKVYLCKLHTIRIQSRCSLQTDAKTTFLPTSFLHKGYLVLKEERQLLFWSHGHKSSDNAVDPGAWTSEDSDVIIYKRWLELPHPLGSAVHRLQLPWPTTGRLHILWPNPILVKFSSPQLCWDPGTWLSEGKAHNQENWSHRPFTALTPRWPLRLLGNSTAILSFVHPPPVSDYFHIPKGGTEKCLWVCVGWLAGGWRGDINHQGWFRRGHGLQSNAVSKCFPVSSL